MKYRAIILEIKPCGCGSEGEISAQLSSGRKIWFYYQGSSDQASQGFPVGDLVEVELIGELSTAIIIAERSKPFFYQNDTCRFEAFGEISSIESDGEQSLFVLESDVKLAFDNELGKRPISVGDYVRVTGELRAHYL